MKEVFNIKRFAKCVEYDLNRVRNNFGISFLIISLSPVIVFLFITIGNMFGAGNETETDIICKAGGMLISLIGLTFAMPAKVFGDITERRAGSMLLMMPASAFEKWLSMILTACILVPLAAGILFISSDVLLSALIPSYGKNIFFYLSVMNEKTEFIMGNSAAIRFITLLILQVIINILVFLLGSIVFKRAKAAKTILSLIVVGIVGSFIKLIANVNWGSDFSVFRMAFDNDFHSLMDYAGMYIWSYSIIFALLLAASFFRIKTIKH